MDILYVSPRIVIADDVIICEARAADTSCDPKTDPKLNDEDFILEEHRAAPRRTHARRLKYFLRTSLRVSSSNPFWNEIRCIN